ncbi:alpha/beta hydrolase [Colwellia psychrerythraea]|nr:alpha/beta hydrolase-fold protein [Colwellia psychrerythraea]
MNMKKCFTLAILLFLPFLTVHANDVSETSDFTLSKIQVASIKDTQADRQYELYIKLPEEYTKNKDKIYPVIYFTDALWHIELLSAATEFLMEDAILVGISWQKDIKEDLQKDSGAHVSRFRDYSISKSSNPERQAKYQFGQASNHLDFIRNDVIKTIENNYRADPNKRTYFGYSMGGKFGAYILLTQHDTFKNYILGSPSLSRDIPYLSKLSGNTALKRKGLNANVFISYGTLEKKLGMHTEKLITLLKARNDKSLSLKHVVIEGSHQTAFPLTGVRSVTWLTNLNTD